ncbi:MAG: hypothetical protein J6Z40_05660 [Oscillospiraceae bacterium]|jgi:hypothetical protein|nr:hypothetical protein [Oscillospiraceae bacterium]MBQ5338635.1 hypothetical protein [Oscillospiraceae bacterium]
MTVVWQSLVKLGVTIYLLFGGYTLFCGFIEKSRKKRIIGALVLIVPTILIAVLLRILYLKYGA